MGNFSMAFMHFLSYFLLNVEKIHSHAIFFPLYPYTLLILNSIYKDTFSLNQLVALSQQMLFHEC